MKRIIFSYLLLTIICGSYIVTSCSDKNEMVKPEIVADEISKNIEVAWDEIEASVKFTINTDWKVIAVDAAGEICSWMQLGKNQGSSGNISIPILFELNDSETTRTGSIKVMAGDIEESFTILQMANPNAVLTMNESDIIDFDKYYKPAEFQNIDMLRSEDRKSVV